MENIVPSLHLGSGFHQFWEILVPDFDVTEGDIQVFLSIVVVQIDHGDMHEDGEMLS